MKRFIETVNDDEVKNIIEAKIINKRWTGAHVSVTKDTGKSARAENEKRRQAKRKELGLENVEEGTALQVKMALSDAGLKGKWKNNKVYVDKKDVDSAKKALKGNVIYRGKPPEVVAEDSSPVVEIVPAIVGGIGNPFGAFLGGYVIAFAEIFLTYAYKKFFTYILPEALEPDSFVQLLSTDYKFAVSFSILVVVLLFRPSGIFKGKVL